MKNKTKNRRQRKKPSEDSSILLPDITKLLLMVHEIQPIIHSDRGTDPDKKPMSTLCGTETETLQRNAF